MTKKAIRKRGTKPRGRHRRVGQPRTAASLAGSAHVTPAGANIFADLGFAANEAENLKMRSRLMIELRKCIIGLPQARAAALLGVSQPRISHLVSGKIDLFTIDTLVNMLAHAGARMRITVTRRRRPAA